MTENNTFFANTPASCSTDNQHLVSQIESEKLTETVIQSKSGMVKRVDLTKYAVERSMAHRGDPGALNNMFNEIRCGHLIDESEDFDLQEQYQFKLADQIIQFEKESEEMLGEKLKIKEVSIPKLKSKVSELDRELHNWILKLEQPAEKDIMNKFTLWKLGISLFLGLVYICLFYISCVYMGMVRNPMAEAEALYKSGGDTSSLFAAIFSVKAFNVIDFHYVSPILLLLFAVLLDHIFTNAKGVIRVITMVVAVLITLVLDALIAYKIENTNFEMKKLMGIEDPSHVWYLSSDFYIVLIMGFVATLVWGFILIAFKRELQKTDHKKVIGLEMSFVKKHINDLNDEISILELALQDLETKLRKIVLDIKKLGERKNDLRISIPELDRYIAKFFDGWMEVITVLRDEVTKKECQQVYENFRAMHIKEKNDLLDDLSLN